MSTAASPGPKILWQFDEFLVDPVRRVLLRDGEVAAVTPKALSILLILLERQGEVVTKQELIQRIWPDTFVTEANLTQNISSLRKVLGDRGNARRTIVTVPGLGYSFAGQAVPVEVPEASASEEALPAADPGPPRETGPATVAAFTAAPAPPGQPPAPARFSGPPGARRTVEIEAVPPLPPRPAPVQRVRRPWIFPAALALAALAAFGAVWLGARRPHPPATSVQPAPRSPGTDLALAARRSAVAVLGFRNLSETEEAEWLAPALAEMLTTELSAGSKLRVISGDNVVRARRSLSLPYADHLRSADLERLHSFLGADRVVVGAYLALGKENGRRIRLDLRVIKIPEGDAMATLSEVGTEADLFDLVARTGAKLRDALGVTGLSADDVQAARALRLANPEAARLYVLGVARLRAYDPPGARDLLLAAERADPGSALIHSALAQAWTTLGYETLAVEEGRKALDLSQPLSREERLAIQARLEEAGKSWSKASETYRTLWAFFPDDLDYGLHLATTLMMAGRAAEARSTLAALRNLPGPPGQDPRIDLMEARVASRLSDIQGQQRAAAAAAAKGNRSGERLVVANAMVMEADALRIMGRTDEAIQRLQKAREIAERAGFQWVVGMALSNLGLAFQGQGDLAAAERAQRESLAVAQRIGTGIGIAAQYYLLGGLHQDRGDLKEARKMLDQSESLFQDMGDRMMQTQALNRVAAVQVAQGDLGAAQRSSERAITLSRETGNRGGEGQALQGIGAILDLQDDLGEARSYYLRAFQIFRELGDSGLAATALAAAADVKGRQGDLEGARRRFEHALAAKRRSGDRLGEAEILGALARLSYETGDLAQARSLTEKQLRAAAASGSRALGTAALQSLGRLHLAAGDVASARRSFQEAASESSRLGEELKATASRLGLAEVALAEGEKGAAEAAGLARAAAAWYGARGMREREAGALALLAEAYLRGGDLTAAREAAGRARAQAEKSEDRGIRIAVATRTARVEAAAGGDSSDPAAPLQVLTAAIAEAEKAGLVPAALEARLALGEIQLARQDPRGDATLAAVRAAAAARGFALLARRAAGPLETLHRLG